MKSFIMLTIVISLAGLVVLGGPQAIAAPDDSVSGGGQIRQETEGETLRIGFGGFAEENVDSFDGQFSVRFHDVGDDQFDKSKFQSSQIINMQFFGPDSEDCIAAMNMTMEGTLDGESGYQLIFRASDFGPPGHWTSSGFDSIRVQLYDGPADVNGDGEVDPNNLVYNSFPDFDAEIDCVGNIRTGLDSGNIAIDLQ